VRDPVADVTVGELRLGRDDSMKTKLLNTPKSVRLLPPPVRARDSASSIAREPETSGQDKKIDVARASRAKKPQFGQYSTHAAKEAADSAPEVNPARRGAA